MSENRKCLVFIWQIKNFIFCSGISEINSPDFFATVFGGIKLSLCLCPDDKKFPGCVTCYIQRQNDTGPLYLPLDCEISLLAGNGTVLCSEISLKTLYKTFCTDWKTALHVSKQEVLLNRKDLFMPDDTLTIRYRVWNSQNLILQSERCFVKTSIETQCKSFVGIIKKFSCLESCDLYPVSFISSKENFLSSMNLRLAADDKLIIEMVVSQKFFRPYRYKIFIRDIFRNKVKYGQGECHDSKLHCFPLTLSKKNLMENKIYYFPKNILIIECEIFSTGKTIKKDVEIEYGFDFQDTQECISNTMEKNLPSKEYHSESFATLKDDLNSLVNEGVLCDTELKTATKTFSVHKVVLSARSPVFKSMFTNDTKKKSNKCVVISDFDADTVYRMLKFMYLDILDVMEYESAKSLYLAAVKYDIVSLRRMCSNFLKQYILLKNCCDMLFLAAKHRDKDLRNAVEDYITKNDTEVLFSDEWKNLEKNHPQLTIEILRFVYAKNRRM